MVYCDPDLLPEDNNEAYKQLISQSIFIKFDAKEQIEKGNRTITKSTLDWWSKQGDLPRKTSFDKSPNDSPVFEGLTALRKFWSGHKNAKNLPIWVRGNLDQLILDSLMRAFDFDAFVNYNVYRDIRTALDLIYTETAQGGYVEIPDFDIYQVIKHNPVHDCAYDALMLIRGKQ
jgi:hypothetical protein